MRAWLKILPILAGLGFLPGGCNSEDGGGLLVYERINEAAKKGDLADVKRHLHRGVAINAKDLGCTPLHVAAAHGRLDVVSFLIRHGADVNARCSWDRTPLLMIVSKSPGPNARWDWDIADGKNVGQDRLAVMKFLIANGADVNARGHSRKTSLYWAVKGKHRDAEELLRQHGAEDTDAAKGTNPYWDIISGARRTGPAAGAPKED